MKKALVSNWYSYLTELTNSKEKPLTEITANRLKKTRMKSYLAKKSPNQLEHIFDGKLRFTQPFISGASGDRDEQLLYFIKKIQIELGWNVDLSEPFGYATKTVKSTVDGKVYNNKKRVRIGPLFKELSPAAEEFWIKNSKFYTSKENLNYFSSQYVLVYSRAPIDILRMSDMDSWTSCHSVEGSYFKCAIEEAVGGGAIVYVVKKEELNGVDLQASEIFRDRDRDIGTVNPLSRLRIRRIVKEGVDFGVPEAREYGSSFSGFIDTVRRFLFQKQEPLLAEITSPSKILNLSGWTLTGGTYEDNDFASLLDSFLDQTEYGYKGFNKGSPGIVETKESTRKTINNLIQETNNDNISVHANILDGEDGGFHIKYYADISFNIVGQFNDFEDENFRSKFAEIYGKGYSLRNLFTIKNPVKYTYFKNSNTSKLTFSLFSKNAEDYGDERGIYDFRFFINDIAYYIINNEDQLYREFVQIMRLNNQLPNPFFDLELENLHVYRQDPNRPGKVLVRSTNTKYVPEFPKFEDLKLTKIPLHLENTAKHAFRRKLNSTLLIQEVNLILNKVVVSVFESFSKKMTGFGKQRTLGALNTRQFHPETTTNNIEALNMKYSDDNYLGNPQYSKIANLFKWLGGKLSFDLNPNTRVPYYTVALTWDDGVSEGRVPNDPTTFITFCKFIDKNLEELQNFISHKVLEMYQEKIEGFIEDLQDQIKNNSEEIKHNGAEIASYYQDSFFDTFRKDNVFESKVVEPKQNRPIIKYKTKELQFFLDTFKGIKQLRVPSWYLQHLYSRGIDENAMAVVAFDQWKPVGIGTISITGDEVEGQYVALANLYVQPEYRGNGIASQIFRKLEKLSSGFKYVEAGRRTAEMFSSRGYEKLEEEPMEIAGGFMFLNKNYK